MPTETKYFKVFIVNEGLRPEEFATKQDANYAIEKYFDNDGSEYQVAEFDRFVESKEEQAATQTVFLLTCENCNGEYGEECHYSIHQSLEGAKETHAKLINPEDLKCKDAVNKWRPLLYGKNGFEFRTGNWGYVCWEIRPVKLLK